MKTAQEYYDDAMFDFSREEYGSAIRKLREALSLDPAYFDAQLSLGMAHYRLSEYDIAIEEGLKAEKMRPDEQLVHTNLSLYYMRKGDKETAEKHGLQARIASWRGKMDTPRDEADSELRMAQPAPKAVKIPEKFPDMPWKKSEAKDEGSDDSLSVK